MTDSRVEITQLPTLPARPQEAHKGDFGRVLVVAGSTGMAGAGALTAMAALRTGAGLVTLLVPERIYDIAAQFSPCVMTHPCEKCRDYFTTEALEQVKHLLTGITVVALGPGLGRREETGQFVRGLAKMASETPMVLDADGLFGVKGQLDVVAQRKAGTVLTPHPGEMAYLLGSTIEEIQEHRTASALRLAKTTGAVAVLKGHETVTAEGGRYYVNETGNPGMATAGTGDVLTGVIAGLMAQGMGAFDAACLGTYLHGLAGDIAAEEVGEPSVVATDLVDKLAAAFNFRADMGPIE